MKKTHKVPNLGTPILYWAPVAQFMIRMWDTANSYFSLNNHSGFMTY